MDTIKNMQIHGKNYEFKAKYDSDGNQINTTYSKKSELNSHILDNNNPHNVTKAQVGLENVDNTSDLDKPISTATREVLDEKVNIKVVCKIINKYSGMPIGVRGHAWGPAVVEQQNCGDFTDQVWDITKQNDGYYVIIGNTSNLAINPRYGGINNNDVISQDYLNGTASQKWDLIPYTVDNKIYYRILNLNSNLSLTVEYNNSQQTPSTVAGAAIRQTEWTGGAEQLWSFDESVSIFPSMSIYWSLSEDITGWMSVDASWQFQDEALIKSNIGENPTNASAYWRLIYNEDEETFKIQNIQNGYYARVYQDSTNKGTGLIVSSDKDAISTNFRLIEVASSEESNNQGYYIQEVNSGLVLGIDAGSTTDQTNIIIWDQQEGDIAQICYLTEKYNINTTETNINNKPFATQEALNQKQDLIDFISEDTDHEYISIGNKESYGFSTGLKGQIGVSKSNSILIGNNLLSNIHLTGIKNSTTYKVVSNGSSGYWMMRNCPTQYFSNRIIKSKDKISEDSEDTKQYYAVVTSIDPENETITVSETLNPYTDFNDYSAEVGGYADQWSLAIGSGRAEQCSIVGWDCLSVPVTFVDGASIAVGCRCIAIQDNTCAFNWQTIATNFGESAFGISNKSNTGSADNQKTLFSIGNGTRYFNNWESSKQKNAIEIMKNGDFYVVNVGGYDGTNYSEAETIQEVINNKADAISTISSESGEVTKTIEPNKLYKFGKVSSLNITLGSEIPNIYNEYMFEFTSGDTPTVLTLPETVKWIGDSLVDNNKTYQVSIVNNIAVMGGA